MTMDKNLSIVVEEKLIVTFPNSAMLYMWHN